MKRSHGPPHLEAIWGRKLTIVINHLLTGMIFQAGFRQDFLDQFQTGGLMFATKNLPP